MSKQTMSKVLHIVNDRGNINVRRLWDATKGERYHSRFHFMPHEASQFLEHVLRDERYVQFTAHASGQEDLDIVCKWLSNLANKKDYAGIRTGPNNTLEGWRFIYGSYTDKGSMIMVPSKSEIKSLDDLGIHVINPEKAPKYLKRSFAPHEHAVFGKIQYVDQVEDGTITQFKRDDGYIGLHRNIELDKLPSDLHRACVDGQGRLSVQFLDSIGVKDRNLNTYGCKKTVFDPIGLDKGFGHAQENLKFDIVSYGAKTQVRYDNFFFGILGGLKPGLKFRSDNQSLGNFDEYPWAAEGAMELQQEIAEAIGDKDKLRAVLMRRLEMVTKADDDPSATEAWMLINAIRAGMDPEAEPSLFRRVMDLTELMQCDKGRIPYDKFGMRCDAMPDPNMFDELGDVHPERTIIPAGCMVSMDVPQGPVVTSRQPNGHALERNDVMNLHMRQFEKFSGRRRNIYGSHGLIEHLQRENGMDLDDTERVIFDPKMVKHIREQTYPITNKMVITEPKKMLLGRTYSYLTRTVENLSTASFTPKDFDKAMERARTMTVKLGTVVNTISLDTLLSGPHKASMIEYLTAKLVAAEDKETKQFYMGKIEWLGQREDYLLRDVATNLEAVIDYCVQGKGDARQFEGIMELVNDVRQNTQVYPMFLAKPGTGFQGQGKISPKKKLGVDYILAPSLLCKAMMEVEQQREVFLNDLRAYEWNCITPVPEKLDDMYPMAYDINRIARDIRDWFNPKAIAAMSIGDAALRRSSYNDVLYGTFHKCKLDGDPSERCASNCPKKNLVVKPGWKAGLIEQGLKQIMEELEDEDTRLLVAVEMKRIVHRNIIPQIDEETGKTKKVPDGVFGNNIIFNYYLKALDNAGLTGKYVPVDLDQVSLSRGIKDQIIDVIVNEKGIVLRKKDHFWLGTVDYSNGEYRLVNGMLEVRKPDISITADANYAYQDEDVVPTRADIDV